MSERELSIAEFASVLAEAVTASHEIRKKALEHGAKIVEKEAKRVIGTYDYDWPQLAQATQDERERLGYPANEPLLREGTMRDSIEHTVKAEEGEADIGSNDDIAVYQELGTSTIPARPFLAGAGAAKAEEVSRVIGAEILGLTFGAVELIPPPSD